MIGGQQGSMDGRFTNGLNRLCRCQRCYFFMPYPQRFQKAAHAELRMGADDTLPAAFLAFLQLPDDVGCQAGVETRQDNGAIRQLADGGKQPAGRGNGARGPRSDYQPFRWVFLQCSNAQIGQHAPVAGRIDEAEFLKMARPCFHHDVEKGQRQLPPYGVFCRQHIADGGPVHLFRLYLIHQARQVFCQPQGICRRGGKNDFFAPITFA